MSEKKELQEKIKAMKNRYRSKLPSKLSDIKNAFSDFKPGEKNDSLYRLVHTIAGSAHSFGLSEISDVAMIAEESLSNRENSADEKVNELLVCIERVIHDS